MTTTDLAREPRTRREPVNESASGRPAPPLQPFIASYSGYRQAGVPPAIHAGLPSPYMTVIFTLDEPLTIAAHPDPAQPGDSYLTLAGGLHTAPALITHEGAQSGIQLAVSPLASRALLGIPASELVSHDVDATEVCGGLATEVQERIQSADNWRARFAVLDEALSRRLRSGAVDGRQDVSAEVRFAWERLLATGGRITVAALAEETGWSARHLRTKFAGEVGLTPKAAARVVRFDRARRLLQRRAASGRPLDLAALAAHCGYYDQAHMDAEFRALAGSAPTTWLVREFRNLQAGMATPEEG
ncbi:MAG TPA: AraC family transcriptional regulator [Streptosporangiaceae bacterium]|jgi:AraC-like DNA-binding protein|nr:AraC family transcriptional regulator [Streptosporangiaceae bacterium]